MHLSLFLLLSSFHSLMHIHTDGRANTNPPSLSILSYLPSSCSLTRDVRINPPPCCSSSSSSFSSSFFSSPPPTSFPGTLRYTLAPNYDAQNTSLSVQSPPAPRPLYTQEERREGQGYSYLPSFSHCFSSRSLPALQLHGLRHLQRGKPLFEGRGA